ncbi:glycosyltransferase [Metapseudomonas lalkuanensis]|uniref:glycosyltransferase n=1 Tax=Metapseudomonas lalkuanensis TaxID=2604832 RepID=UPI001CF4BCF1|nr:glycosyltransferase [Pseudomonas lalkuanensis]UCP00016.1 glycosyltransferase [Pseudomonas lalkuanensis]
MNLEGKGMFGVGLANPLVSLVIPAYNAERYVAETIKSVLDQSYKNIEVIVINDGSTDSTESILSGFSDSCTIVSQKNVGQAATLNSGWQMSRGEFVGYLSADDTLEPTAVAQLVAAFAAHPNAVLLYPDYCLIDEKSRHLRDVVAPEFVYRDVVLKGECPVGPGALFRREVLSSTEGWDPLLRQIPDYDFLLRVGLFGEVRRVPGFLAGFRVHDDSQTFTVSDERKTDEYRYVLRKYFERTDIPAYLNHERSRAEANACVLMARLHLRAGRFVAALHCLEEAYGLSASSLLCRRSVRLLLSGLLGRYRYWLTIKFRR